MVALLRAGGRAWARYLLRARESAVDRACALDVLERELGLLSYEALDSATTELRTWRQRGYQAIPSFATEYPENLRAIAARPALLFAHGRLDARDAHSVAVIGTRTPSAAGRELGRALAQELARDGFTVVSGLAQGIDRVVHRAVLDLAPAQSQLAPRTLAVIGTGLDHAYPPEHAELQREIAAHGAVISQFWPEARASRRSFPARNAVMSGLTLGSVVVEASEHSGTRIQVRHALAQGRRVVLMGPALRSSWASALADTPGVVVAADVAEVVQSFRA